MHMHIMCSDIHSSIHKKHDLLGQFCDLLATLILGFILDLLVVVTTTVGVGDASFSVCFRRSYDIAGLDCKTWVQGWKL